jgi:site-specific recombinase XerD
MEIIHDFIDWLKKNGYSQATISNYYFSINQFLIYLTKNKIGSEKFSEKNYLDFITEFTVKKSKQSKNSHIYAILKYCDFLNKIRGMKIEIKNLPLEKTSKKDFKPVKNINDLSGIILNSGKEMAERDGLLLTMLYETGLKTKELLKTKPRGIKNESININGKIVKINLKLQEKIFYYCRKNNIGDNQFLFFSYAGKKKNYNSPITERAAQEIIKNLKKITGSDFSINDLRKSLFANIFSNNIKVENIFKHVENFADKKNFLQVYPPHGCAMCTAKCMAAKT